MRNLKRALSLALASVMVLGLMIVGSSAAAYPDVDSEDNLEAIEVLKAVGVMVGDASGNFNPDEVVTRAEMATIMARMMDYKLSNYEGYSNFKDVTGTYSWAQSAINACYTHGIVKGYSSSAFGPGDQVTTVQAALLMMRALGYFQFDSDNGENWVLSAIVQANKIDLFEGIDASVEDGMKRNDVAQLALNTLKATQVVVADYPIVFNGQTIKNAQYGDLLKEGSRYKTINDKKENNNSYTAELGEDLFEGRLVYGDSTDAFQAPSKRWVYNNLEIGKYPLNVMSSYLGAVKSSKLYADLGSTIVDNINNKDKDNDNKDNPNTYKFEVYIDGLKLQDTPYVTESTTYTNWYKNNKNDDVDESGTTGDQLDCFVDQLQKNNSKDLLGTGRGTITSVYVDEDNNKVTVCIKNQYAAEVVKSANGTITLEQPNGKSLTYSSKDYAEDQVVLFTKTFSNKDDAKDNKGKVREILGVAELVSGEVTRVEENTNFTIDGTKYAYNRIVVTEDKVKTGNVGGGLAFYLDTQGNFIMASESNIKNDYAYVLSVGDGQTNIYGSANEVGAQLLLTDGTKKNVMLDLDDDSAEAKSFEYQVVSYTEESNGKFKLEKVTDGGKYDFVEVKEDIIKNGAATVTVSGEKKTDPDDPNKTFIEYATKYADRNTAFVVSNSNNSKKFTSYVGYGAVPTIDAANGTTVAYCASGNILRAVFVLSGEVKSTKDIIFIVGNKDAKEIKEGSNTYYNYKALVNGEVKTLSVKYSKEKESAYEKVSSLATDAIGVYVGMNTSDNLVTKLFDNGDKDIKTIFYDGGKAEGHKNAGTGHVTAGGNLCFGWDQGKKEYTDQYANSEDAVIAYYDGSNIELRNRVATDRDDEAVVVTDNGVIVAVFVKEVNN